MRFTPQLDQLGIKPVGILKIAGNFQLKLSDFMFRNYRALNFSKKCLKQTHRLYDSMNTPV